MKPPPPANGPRTVGAPLARGVFAPGGCLVKPATPAGARCRSSTWLGSAAHPARARSSLTSTLLSGAASRSPGPERRIPLVPFLDHRMHAANWFADRGRGKVKETIELVGEETSPAERLRILRELSGGWGSGRQDGV